MTKYHKRGGLNNRNSFFHSSLGWKSEIITWHCRVLLRALTLTWGWPLFLCVLTWNRWIKLSSLSLLERTLIPSWGLKIITSSKPNYLQIPSLWDWTRKYEHEHESPCSDPWKGLKQSYRNCNAHIQGPCLLAICLSSGKREWGRTAGEKADSRTELWMVQSKISQNIMLLCWE